MCQSLGPIGPSSISSLFLVFHVLQPCLRITWVFITRGFRTYCKHLVSPVLGVYASSSRRSRKWRERWQWRTQVAVQLCGMFIIQFSPIGPQASRFLNSQTECRKAQRFQNQVIYDRSGLVLGKDEKNLQAPLALIVFYNIWFSPLFI